MMEFLRAPLEVALHLDTYLASIIQQCGGWTYWILFLVIFAETGLVVTPFLPGDSMLFMLGAFAAQGTFHPVLLAGILMSAAILGDSANYAIGKYLGDRLLYATRIPFVKKSHLERTHRFYEKYGGKTIVLARFMPIIRTFAPFVAGIAHMEYGKFLVYNVVGGIMWVAIFVFGGYYFGNIPVVKEHFSLVVLIIIIISILPGAIEFVRVKCHTPRH